MCSFGLESALFEGVPAPADRVGRSSSAVQSLLSRNSGEDTAVSLVRLLGFRTLACGCVIGRYRELATSRELTYVEEKGQSCDMYGHRRNHSIAVDRIPQPVAATLAVKAS